MSKKNKTTAGLLALFLGSLGAHKFYLGKTKMGIIYLVLCLTGISALIALYEGVQYLRMSDDEFDSKYNPSVAQNTYQDFASNNSQSQGDYQNVSEDVEQNFSDDNAEDNAATPSDSDNSSRQDLARTLKDVNKIIKGVQKLANKFNNDNTEQNEYYNEDEYNDDENNR